MRITVRRSGSRWPAGVAVLCLTLASAAFAKANPEYTKIGRDISVASDQETGDVTCLGCNIHIRGQVSGDATAVGGSIFVEDQAQVSGDVTAIAGNVRIDKMAKVGGDATVVGGDVRRAPGAEVGGDVTSVGGAFWGPLILLAPFLFIGLLVGLVVWLVQRSRRPAVPAAAA